VCEVDGIEVTREEKPAWDAAVAAFQRNLRSHLQVIRASAADDARCLLGDQSTGLFSSGGQAKAVVGNV